MSALHAGADVSLDKPWDKRPASVPALINVAPTSVSSDKELPPDLIKLVANSAPQESMTDYEAVHMWWWVAYIALVGELKASGDEVVWREMDKYIGQ